MPARTLWRPGEGCPSDREAARSLRLTKAAELVEAAVEETLAYYGFPEEHWRRIPTNNPLERLLRESEAPVWSARSPMAYRHPGVFSHVAITA